MPAPPSRAIAPRPAGEVFARLGAGRRLAGALGLAGLVWLAIAWALA